MIASTRNINNILRGRVQINIQLCTSIISKEPDVVWTGIGRKIPVIVFYASVLDLDLKERYSITGKNFVN